MADVLELTAFVLAGSCWQRRRRSLECLYAGLLVARDDVRPRFLERRGLGVHVADLGDLLGVQHRIPDLGVEPVLRAMRVEIRVL
jgi:hypothetical protein